MYAHEAIFALFPVVSSLSALHIVFHGLAPAGYLHAIVLFPDGKVAPPWLKWIIPVMYAVMAVFIAWNTYVYIVVPFSFFEANLGGWPSPETFTKFAEINIVIDIVLVGVFFGIATPALGALSQRYRARSGRPTKERQQALLVVWALTIASVASLVVLFAGGATIFATYGGFTSEAWHRLEMLTMQMFPPIFSIVPIALLIAIFRYQLFDIEMLVNRTMVYAPLTAILGGLIPPAVVGFRWLIEAFTGEKQSEVALILAALFISAVASHLRPKLQVIADRHFRPRPDQTKRLLEFGNQVRSVIQVIDGSQMASKLLDEAVGALGTDRGAITLTFDGTSRVVRTKGTWDGIVALEVPLQRVGERMGSLPLGPRTNQAPYTPQDILALNTAADAVSQALALLGEEQWRKMTAVAPASAS